MLAKLHSATLQGLNAIPVCIEVDSYEGGQNQKFSIVGLPDNAIKESQERINAVLRQNKYKSLTRSIVVNLSPADIRKEGSGFDLPIALGVLLSYKFIEVSAIERYMFVGELGLDGTVLPITKKEYKRLCGEWLL